MSITNTDITTADIRKLRDESGEAGDLAMVAICDIALHDEISDRVPLAREDRELLTRKGMLVEGGQARARAECERVIREARAQG